MERCPGISESQNLKISLLSASHVSFVASHQRAREKGLLSLKGSTGQGIRKP